MNLVIFWQQPTGAEFDGRQTPEMATQAAPKSSVDMISCPIHIKKRYE
jgi:hypothetical protein